MTTRKALPCGWFFVWQYCTKSIASNCHKCRIRFRHFDISHNLLDFQIIVC